MIMDKFSSVVSGLETMMGNLKEAETPSSQKARE
jgi:hypothetical protein